MRYVHESKLLFVSVKEFIGFKLWFLFAHITVVNVIMVLPLTQLGGVTTPCDFNK